MSLKVDDVSGWKIYLDFDSYVVCYLRAFTLFRSLFLMERKLRLDLRPPYGF